jgi:N-acetylglucosamine-6-sulfatase
VGARVPGRAHLEGAQGVTGAAPRRWVAGATLAAALGLASSFARPSAAPPPDHRPNVIVVLTDDQGWDTLEAMPWLHGELGRSGSGWARFPLAFATTPLCCPARASLLTGRYPRHTGVLRNADGARLDESQTLATWLHAAGYRTGLVGKYLNGYPFGRLPYVPAGWDRFVAKRNLDDSTVYRDFDAIDQGSPVHVTDGYATDWLAERAVGFVRTAPQDRPFFLLFAPSAPHEPWVPAERDRGAEAGLTLEEPPNVAGALHGAPPWVRALPTPSAAQRATWLDERRRERETLLAVDDAIRSIVGALGDRLANTVIFVLSDHGYSFGEHRWAGKRCPYEACVRIPFVVHAPFSTIFRRSAPISTVDVAPTVLGLARVPRPSGIDGVEFAGRLEAPGPGLPVPPPEAVFLEWAGDGEIPAWEAVRTRDLKLIRYADGTEELYDVAGRLGPADPFETDNRLDDQAYRDAVTEMRALLGRHPGRR